MSVSEPVLEPNVAQPGAVLLSIAFRLEHLADEAPPSVPCDMTAPDEYVGDSAAACEPGDGDGAAA
jgi:hypothetical protein